MWHYCFGGQNKKTKKKSGQTSTETLGICVLADSPWIFGFLDLFFLVSHCFSFEKNIFWCLEKSTEMLFFDFGWYFSPFPFSWIVYRLDQEKKERDWVLLPVVCVCEKNFWQNYLVCRTKINKFGGMSGIFFGPTNQYRLGQV